MTKREDLLSRTDAAKYLGVSARWLDKRVASGTGPSVVRFGRLVRYLKADLDRFIDEHCREVVTCRSTETHDRQTSGGVVSKSVASDTVSQQAKEIGERLRQRNAG